MHDLQTIVFRNSPEYLKARGLDRSDVPAEEIARKLLEFTKEHERQFRNKRLLAARKAANSA